MYNVSTTDLTLHTNPHVMNDFYKKVAEEYKRGTPLLEIVKLTGKSKSSIARAVKRLNLEHPNKDNRQGVKIEVDGSLKGVTTMHPTKAQLEALGDTVRRTNYRSIYGVHFGTRRDSTRLFS